LRRVCATSSLSKTRVSDDKGLRLDCGYQLELLEWKASEKLLPIHEPHP
jgi:hypothetical protein